MTNIIDDPNVIAQTPCTYRDKDGNEGEGFLIATNTATEVLLTESQLKAMLAAIGASSDD